MFNPWLIIGVALFLAGAAYKLDSNGYNRCEANYASAAQLAEEKAALEIEDIRKKAEERIKELQNVPFTPDEKIIAPVLSSTLDGLHTRHASE